MNTKQKAITAIAIALVPLLMLFGFNALVVQPQLGELSAEARGLGPIKFSNPVVMNQTLDVDGNANVDGTLTVDGASTLAGAVSVGGGYGDTGCTFSAAGVLQCNGAATFGSTADVASTLNYGASNLYPVGNAASGYAAMAGKTATFTGTQVLTSSATGLATSITGAVCTLSQAPTAGDGVYMCTATWSGTTLTLTNYTITPSVSAIGGVASWVAFGQP